MGRAVPVYYFGCVDDYGHYPWAPGPKKLSLSEPTPWPWGWKVDGGLGPAGKQVERVAAIHHKDGWTAMSFWDRSVDHRSGSNSTFLAPVELDFDHMLALSTEHFPAVFARLSGPVTEAA